MGSVKTQSSKCCKFSGALRGMLSRNGASDALSWSQRCSPTMGPTMLSRGSNDALPRWGQRSKIAAPTLGADCCWYLSWRPSLPTANTQDPSNPCTGDSCPPSMDKYWSVTHLECSDWGCAKDWRNAELATDYIWKTNSREERYIFLVSRTQAAVLVLKIPFQ